MYFTRTVHLEAGPHKLLLKHNRLTGSKKVYVDGRLALTTPWSLVETDSLIRIPLLDSQDTCIVVGVRATGISTFEYCVMTNSGKEKSAAAV